MPGPSAARRGPAGRGTCSAKAAWTSRTTSVSQAWRTAQLVVVGPKRDISGPGITHRADASEDVKRELLASSKILGAPNLGGESFGVVPLEGMAAGCALVHSDLRAFRDMSGMAGEAFPTGDSDALASTVTALLDNRARLRETQQRCSTRAQSFDWLHIVSRYVATISATKRALSP